MTGVHYCYRCGRPLGPGAGKCLFCSAPVRRVIRPDRRCPYCDEPVRPKAIKCHHCGEFLDGRERESKQPTGGQGQPTFVIEKAIFQGDPRAALPPGTGQQALPAAQYARIESPPGYSDQEPKDVSLASGVSIPAALPAPEQAHGKELIPAPERQPDERSSQAKPASTEIAPITVTGKGGRELAIRDYSQSLPVKAGEGLLPALFRGFRGGKKKKIDDTIDVSPSSEENRYRFCSVCQTEILAEDNYCFNCGQRYHQGELVPKKPRDTRSNIGLYFCVVLLLALYVIAPKFAGNMDERFTRSFLIGAMITSPLLCLAAFFRKRNSMNQFLSIALLVACIVVTIRFWSL